MRSAPRPVPGEQAVLAVVGREHGRRRGGGAAAAPRRRDSTPARTARRRRRRPAAGVDDGCAHGRRTVSSVAAEAGPDTSAWKRCEVVEHGAAPSRTPAAAGATTSAGADRRRRPATTARTIPAPARCAAPAARWAAPGHPRAAGDDAHGPRPLVRASAAGAATSGRRRPPRRGGRRRDDGVEADVGDLDLAGQLAPGAEQQPGLERGERHRAVGGEHAAAGLTGEPVDAARDVDGEHRACARRAAPATRRGTRCRRRRRSRGRRRAASGGQSAASNTRTCTPRRSRTPAGGPAVGAVVALAGDHVDHAAVGPAEHPPGRPGDAPHRPARSSTSTGSGAAASIAAISSGVTIGIIGRRRYDRRRFDRLGDDHGDRDGAVVAQRQVPADDAAVDGQLRAPGR